nr:hypothetical protein [Escherichia coli]
MTAAIVLWNTVCGTRHPGLVGPAVGGRQFCNSCRHGLEHISLTGDCVWRQAAVEDRKFRRLDARKTIAYDFSENSAGS